MKERWAFSFLKLVTNMQSTFFYTIYIAKNIYSM